MVRIDKTNDLPENDPRHHALNVAYALKELAEHLREEIDRRSEPRGHVLFETTASVLLGLARAHDAFAAECARERAA